MTTIEPTTEPADAPEAPDATGPANEAAKYRKRLREAEAERDALSERLTAERKSAVERLAGDRLAAPGDLWQLAELDQMIGDDGGLDLDKVAATIDTVVSERPHWATRPAPVPTQRPTP